MEEVLAGRVSMNDGQFIALITAVLHDTPKDKKSAIYRAVWKTLVPDSKHDKAVDDLMAEMARARKKFPGNRYLLAALVEEVGELGEAMLSGTREEAYQEALQCACVAMRIAEEGDATKYASRYFISLVTSTGEIARGLLQKSRIRISMGLTSLKASVGLMEMDPDPTFAHVTDDEAKP